MQKKSGLKKPHFGAFMVKFVVDTMGKVRFGMAQKGRG